MGRSLIMDPKFLVAVGCALLAGSLAVGGCSWQTPVSNSGVPMVKTHITVGSDGMTTEQRNIVERLKIDNTPGSIKHLYLISPFNGDVLIYSTVRGKVTSSGKRLTPVTVAGGTFAIPLEIGNQATATNEVVQDDGTFGSSVEYLYWFDIRGAFHAQYIGSALIHISDQPIQVKKAIIDIEAIAAGK